MLEEQKIRYAVLRNYEQLPESTGGSDIDMWVAAEDCQRFFNNTIDIAKQCDGRLVSYIWKRHEPKICFLGTDWGTQIDVYTGLVPIGNRVFYTGELMEKHSILFNGIKVLHPHWAAIEAFLKEVLNNGHCNQKEKYYNDASDAIRSMPQKELNAGLPMFSDEFINLLTRIGYEKKSYTLISNIYRMGIKELKFKVERSGFDGLLKFMRIFKRPGFMIAILGTDGSGKSAIYKSILPILEDAFHKGIHYCHLRPHLLPDIGVALGKRKEDKSITICSNPHAKKSSGKIGSLIRLFYYLQDYVWGYWMKIWPTIAIHSHVYILDRYYYDYYIDQSRSRISLPNWIIKTFEVFVPKPDIVLCLGGNPEQIYKRKPETSLEEVKRQTNELRKFCNSHENAFWVDTTGVDIETSSRNALSGILKIMNNRFATVRKL